MWSKLVLASDRFATRQGGFAAKTSNDGICIWSESVPVTLELSDNCGALLTARIKVEAIEP